MKQLVEKKKICIQSIFARNIIKNAEENTLLQRHQRRHIFKNHFWCTNSAATYKKLKPKFL